MMLFFKDYKKLGFNLFGVGVLFLPSAPFIGGLFFIFSLIFSFLNEKIEIKEDSRDYLFIIASVIMIGTSLIHFFNFDNINYVYERWNDGIKQNYSSIITRYSYSSLVGLLNWIPLFICFFGFQPFLKSPKNRKIILKLFLIGSIPVLISGAGQLMLNWHSPVELFNGLIIWYQKPSKTFSGLFNNQNYAGCWLNIIWPFALAIFYEKSKNIFKKTTSFVFIVSIFLSSFLTFSRNTWGGLFLTIPLVLGPITVYWFIVFFIIALILIFLNSFNFLPENISNLLSSLLPAKFNIFEMVLDQFSSDSYPNQANARRTIFGVALKLIAEKPLIGWGAAAFPIYYGFKKGIFISHTHNLFIDTGFNYGIVAAICIFTNIFLICIASFKKIYLKKITTLSENYFERAWWTSFFILLCSQMFDVQYYDGRISIAFWILLAGLKCIISEDDKNMTYTI